MIHLVVWWLLGEVFWYILSQLHRRMNIFSMSTLFDDFRQTLKIPGEIPDTIPVSLCYE